MKLNLDTNGEQTVPRYGVTRSDLATGTRFSTFDNLSGAQARHSTPSIIFNSRECAPFTLGVSVEILEPYESHAVYGDLCCLKLIGPNVNPYLGSKTRIPSMSNLYGIIILPTPLARN
jgi:hypothetical protein